MKIYLDTCCYNRPFDDQEQDRVHSESEAVLSIIRRCREEGHILVGSFILKIEIDQMPNQARKSNVLVMYSAVNEEVTYNFDIGNRAMALRAIGTVKDMDSLHLASAEYAGADIFLTTDIRLIKACRILPLRTRVLNPVSYLAELIEEDDTEGDI